MNVAFQDTFSIDAFGRLRTSRTGQRLDVEFKYNKQIDYFDESTNNGTVTYNGNPRDLTLSISDANNGTYSKMSSHPVPYTPGNSQLIEITGVLDLAGIGSGVAQTFIRSSVSGSAVETTNDQSGWSNLTSGIDWTDSHIFLIDFQSLKVGRIRFGLVQNGLAVKIHEITNDNLRNTGYWQLADGSAYYKLYNDATYTYMEIGYGNENNAVGIRYRIAANASATMKAICCTAKSEGGYNLLDMPGLPVSVDLGTSTKTVSTTLVPLISVRPKTTFQSYENLIVSLPKLIGLQTDEAIKYEILLNPTLTGASWNDVDTNESNLEFDIAATVVSGGKKIGSDYIYATSTGPASTRITATEKNFLGKTVLWYRQGSQSGILTLAAIRTGAADASVLASMILEEIR
jgi:hypothetical protein